MIGASYSEIKSAAMDTIGAASEYDGNVENLYAVVNQLGEKWKGTDNQDFVNKVNSYKNDILALGRVVREYGEFLKASGERLERTQGEIAESASRL